jgi:hypothetical protein
MNDTVTAISTTVPKQYRARKTGALLVLTPGMFSFNSKKYSGLMDTLTNTLYDNPEDSFATAAGIPSSLDTGMIELITNDFEVSNRNY